MSLELNNSNFDSTIQNNSMVFIDFWAPWCGPCRAFGPTFEKVGSANPDIVFAKVNTEEHPELAARFQIRSIPTMAIFKNKELIFLQPGALPEAALVEITAKVRDLDMSQVQPNS